MVDLTVQGYPVIIYQWLLFGLATPFVCMRLYVQLYYRARPWREIFIVVAYVLYFFFTVCDSIFNAYDGYNYDIDWDTMTDKEVEPGLRAEFAAIMMYLIILYACKAALLCFYMDLTPKQYFPKLWWSIVGVWGLMIAGVIIRPMEGFLDCPKFSDHWTWSRLGECRGNGHIAWTVILRYSFHLATDVMVYLLPILILRNLTNLTTRQTWSAFGMFALGFINILCALELTLWSTWQWYADTTVGQGTTGALLVQYFLSPFQLASAIIIVCIPYCRRVGSVPQSEMKDISLTGRNFPRPAERADLEAAVQVDIPSTPDKNGETEVNVEAK